MAPLTGKSGLIAIGKQSAKGTPATVFHRFRWLDGTVATNKDISEQEWVDGEWFSDAYDFVQTISGGGTIKFQTDPEGAARLAAWALGSDTVVDNEDGTFTHTAVKGSSPAWLTVFQRDGAADGTNQRRQYQDVMISELKLTAQRSSQVVEGEVSLTSLAPGIVKTADPSIATTSADDEPFLFTQTNAGAVINEVTLHGASSWNIDITTGVAPFYGDEVTAYAHIVGKGGVSGAATVLCDEVSLPLLNESIYGTASPSADATPTADVLHAPVSVECSRDTGADLRSLGITLGKARLTVDNPGPNTDGGAVEIGLAFVARKPASGDYIAITTVTSESAAY